MFIPVTVLQITHRDVPIRVHIETEGPRRTFLIHDPAPDSDDGHVIFTIPLLEGESLVQAAESLVRFMQDAKR